MPSFPDSLCDVILGFVAPGVVVAGVCSAPAISKAQDRAPEPEFEVTPLVSPDHFEHIDPHPNQNEDAGCQTAPECFGKGKNLFDLGDYRNASLHFLDAFNLLSEDNPKRFTALFNAAVCSEQAGDPATARRLYDLYVNLVQNPSQEARIIQKYSALDFYKKGIDYVIAGDAAKALPAFEASEQAFGESAPVALCVDIAKTYELLGEKRKALQHYEFCLGRTSTLLVRNSIAARMKALTSPKPEIQSESLNLDEDVKEEKSEPKFPKEPSFLFRHISSFSAAGIAGVAAGTGVLLQYAGMVKFEELRNSCGRTLEGCSPSEIDGLNSYFSGRNIAYLTAGIAGVTAAGLLVWEYLNNPVPSKQHQSTFPLRLESVITVRY